MAFSLCFGLVLAAVGALPCAVGHAMSDSRRWFTHNLVLDGDFDFYLSFARQAAEGQWLFHNQFTPEPHANVFFNLEFLLTGKLAAATGLSVDYAYMVVAALSTLLYVACLYWLCSHFFQSFVGRVLVVVMITLGGGFGWLETFPIPGIDRLYLADTHYLLHPFFSILLHPHTLLTSGLTLLTLCLFLRAERTQRLPDYLWTGLACTTVGCVRPYDMLYLWCIVCLYTLILSLCRRAGGGRLAAYRASIVAVGLPLMLYYVWLFKMHPVFRWWGNQGVLQPTPAISLMLSMGFCAAFMAGNLHRLGNFRDKSEGEITLACAVACGFALFYSYPLFLFSGQFISELVVPAAILGTFGWERPIVAAMSRSAWAVCGVGLFLLLNSLTSAALLTHTMIELKKGVPFIARGSHDAYEWLGQHSQPREIVMASYSHDMRLPHYAHNCCVTGYKYVTVDHPAKNKIVREFFQGGTSDDRRRQVVERLGVRYVLWGKEDRGQGGFDPSDRRWLGKVYSNEDITIFKVDLPQLAKQDQRSKASPTTVGATASATD
ncbi:MAG TPA: hypothetical protein VNH11_35885 [Pirellulales bacterium]|nr:hypothetical protein [Pirellulales bacterium]